MPGSVLIFRRRAALLAALLLPALWAVHAEEDNRFELKVDAKDPDGDPLTFLWKQVSGPAQVKIADPTSAKTWFTTTEPGEYVFEVQVSDGKDIAIGKKTWKITMPNRKPVAAIDRKELALKMGQQAVLDAGESKDPDKDGKIVAYEWHFKAKPEKSKLKLAPEELKKRTLTFEPDEPGEYRISLIVFDGKDWSDPAESVVRVQIVNQGPVIPVLDTTAEKGTIDAPKPPEPVKPPPALGTPPVVKVKQGGKVAVGTTIVLDGSATKDELGEPMTFFWQQVFKVGEKQVLLRTLQTDPASMVPGSDREELRCPVWKGKIEEPGTYRFVLHVTAGKERKATSEEVVFVATAGNRAPIARLNLKTPIVEKGQTVTLDASASSDEDGHELEYQWLWSGKGHHIKNWVVLPESGTKIVQFVAEEEGEYGIRLVVKEKNGTLTSEPVDDVVRVKGANRAPAVSKLPEKVEAVVGQTVKIEAETEDFEQDPVTVEWRVISPATLKLPKDVLTKKTLTFTPPDRQVYVFEVVPHDGRVAGAAKQVQIFVSDPVNLAPAAKIEGPILATVGTECVFDGGKSSDPEKKRLTYHWKQAGGPALGDPPANSESRWTVTPKEPSKDYEISLVVSDGVNESRPFVFKLEVEPADKPNHAPVAKIAQINAIFKGETIQLDGSESSDEDEGSKLTYAWRLVEGEGVVRIEHADLPRLTIHALKPGSAKIELVVGDGQAKSEPALATVTVQGRHEPPVAKITGPSEAMVGEEIELSAAESTVHGEAKLDAYRWEQPQGGGPSLRLREQDANKATLRFRPSEPGDYVLELIVTDTNGMRSKPVMYSVAVKEKEQEPAPVVAQKPPEGEQPAEGEGSLESAMPPEVPVEKPPEGNPIREPMPVPIEEPAETDPLPPGSRPVAEIRLQGEGPFPVDKPLTLSGAQSKSRDGKPLTFRWRQVNGPEKLPIPEKGGPDLDVTPLKAGEYTIELVVNNGEADSKPVAASFKVLETDIPPTAVIAEIVPVEPGEEVTLDATQSRTADGREVDKVEWDCVSAPEGAKVSFGWLSRYKKKPKVEIELPKAGEYTFSLKVFDGKLWSAPVEAKVATRATNVPPVAGAIAVTGYREEDLNNADGMLTLPWVVKTGPNADKLLVEEGQEVLLDASGSSDPDAGPRPLVYTWRFHGPEPEQQSQDGAYLRFRPSRPGAMLCKLTVYDGKSESEEAQVKIDVVRKGTLPVAKPLQTLIHAEIARRGQPPARNFFILDGTPSKVSDPEAAKFYWRQVGGDDLQLRPESLAKKQVGLRVFHPGRYRFMLIVKDGEFFSLPALVDVLVTDPSAGALPPAEKVKVEDVKPEDGGALLPPPVPEPPAEKPAPVVTTKPEPEPEERPLPPPARPSVKQPEPVAVAEPKPAPVAEPKPAPVEKPVDAPTPAPVVAEAESLPPPPPPAFVPTKEEPKPSEKLQPEGLPGKLADAAYRSDDPLYLHRKQKIEKLALEPGVDIEKQLILAFDDKDPDLRRIAAYAIVQRGMGSVRALIGVLEDGTPEAKTEARWALKELAREDHGADPAAWRKWWKDLTALP